MAIIRARGDTKDVPATWAILRDTLAREGVLSEVLVHTAEEAANQLKAEAVRNEYNEADTKVRDAENEVK